MVFYWERIKVALLYKWKNYCQIQGWKHFVRFCVMRQTSFLGAKSNMHEDKIVARIL